MKALGRASFIGRSMHFTALRCDEAHRTPCQRRDHIRWLETRLDADDSNYIISQDDIIADNFLSVPPISESIIFRTVSRAFNFITGGRTFQD